MLDPRTRRPATSSGRGVVGKVCFACGHGRTCHERVNTYGADPTWYYRRAADRPWTSPSTRSTADRLLGPVSA
jgi:hypothetical protein